MHTRRSFLLSAGATAVAVAGSSATAFAANETLNVGLIGTGGRCRHLLRSLVKIPGVRVTAISDVRDEHSMRYLVRGQDFLFNLAGQTSHADSMQNPYTDLDINCRAQLSILEACRKYNPAIKVVAAELGVAVARQHLDDALLCLHDRHIKGAAA